MCIRDRVNNGGGGNSAEIIQLRGTGNLISGGTPISGFTDEVRYLGHGRIDLTWLGLEKSQYLPVSLVLIAIVYIIFWIFMNKTRTGKWIYAIGGNPNAARASGINVNKILVIAVSYTHLTLPTKA